MNYKELHGKTIKDGFNQFNEQNPHVYQAFEKEVLKAIRIGRTKLSAKMIINVIRWNYYVTRTTDTNFKINDAYQSYYAREFIRLHPKHNDIFTLRKLRNEEPGPFMRVDKNGQTSFL